MTMYLVCADDYNGDNQDYFICANSSDEAFDIYCLNMEAVFGPDFINDNARVFEVPTSSIWGIQPWGDAITYHRSKAVTA